MSKLETEKIEADQNSQIDLDLPFDETEQDKVQGSFGEPRPPAYSVVIDRRAALLTSATNL
jgi:hypothetical protein